jgi:hypothetical protein
MEKNTVLAFFKYRGTIFQRNSIKNWNVFGYFLAKGFYLQNVLHYTHEMKVK